MNEKKRSKFAAVMDVLTVVGIVLALLGFIGMVILSAVFHFGVGQGGALALVLGSALFTAGAAAHRWRMHDRLLALLPGTVSVLLFAVFAGIVANWPQMYASGKASAEKNAEKERAVEAVVESLPADVPNPRDVYASDWGKLRMDKDGNPLPETVIKIGISGIHNRDLAKKVKPAVVSVRIKDGRLVVTQVNEE